MRIGNHLIVVPVPKKSLFQILRQSPRLQCWKVLHTICMFELLFSNHDISQLCKNSKSSNQTDPTEQLLSVTAGCYSQLQLLWLTLSMWSYLLNIIFKKNQSDGLVLKNQLWFGSHLLVQKVWNLLLYEQLGKSDRLQRAN